MVLMLRCELTHMSHRIDCTMNLERYPAHVWPWCWTTRGENEGESELIRHHRNSTVVSLIDEVFHLGSNFFAYECECITMWWMHLQVFKVRTWQVWASPRKQIKQNYHGASTRVEFPELGHCYSISCLFSHGKKQAAVFFINHCINASMCSGVVRSKELYRKVFSVQGETNCLANIRVASYPMERKKKQKEAFLSFRGLGKRTSKHVKKIQISQQWKHDKIYFSKWNQI